MFALPLALVGCNKKEAPRAEYLFDINMTQAERVTEITEEGITLEENRFMVVFTDDKESCMLTLLIQGEEGETTLSAGTYNRALELDECIFVTENGSQYTFSEGIVNVALENKIYTIDALFSDAKGKKYHFTYEGLIANMAEEEEVTEYFVDSKMKSADRLIPAEFYDISDGDMGITLTDGLYTLAMVFTLEDGKDVVTCIELTEVQTATVLVESLDVLIEPYVLSSDSRYSFRFQRDSLDRVFRYEIAS